MPANSKFEIRNSKLTEPPHVGSYDDEFNTLALELFALQFAHNAPYRKFCEAREASPHTVGHWTEIPAVPTNAFKELELSCLPVEGRTTVFHSSGTTEQKPSRHFHNAESLAIYEASLLPWFRAHVLPDKLKLELQPAGAAVGVQASACLRDGDDIEFLMLTPPLTQAPHSSLVHMFETIRQKFGAPESAFVGKTAADGSWTLDFDVALQLLADNSKLKTQNAKLILGTAFSFVHLLDFLAGEHLHFQLPPGSRAMETGGYKGRSRSLSNTELRALITDRLGIPQTHIVCEYGMSELSSQAYDVQIPTQNSELKTQNPERRVRFPPWARAQIISPETGREVAGGETGLIRVFDLANVFSVMAIQTEDLGVRRRAGFELIGRASLAGPRGCSLMTA
jgi:acyl-protein synthetase LuxE